MTPVVTGRDVLRQALRGRKMGLAGVGHELSIATHHLETFLSGGSLATEQLTRLAVFCFGEGITFDEEADRLRAAPQPAPKVLATVLPPQFVRKPLSEIVPPPVASGRSLPIVPRKPKPGWE
jgi:hypothetical protein